MNCGAKFCSNWKYSIECKKRVGSKRWRSGREKEGITTTTINDKNKSERQL